MNKDNQENRIRGAIGALWKNPYESASSMRLRLYAFQFTLVALLVLGVLLTFVATGRFPAGTGDAARYVRREFSYLYGHMTEQYGDMTIQLVSLSQSLSRSIEFFLLEKQIPVSRLQEHTDVLEELIGNELARLKFALERTNGSGVFMILDATVNPELENAEHSRAGVHLRISEPQVSGAASATWNYFRGFPRIAYQNDMNIMVKWDMEFDVKDRDFYHLPILQSAATSLPLSRLYYWSEEGVIPGLDDAVLLCSIPLIDAEGNPFGVCGFEISDWNFSVTFAPIDGEYRDTTYLFGMIDGNRLNTNTAKMSGMPTTVSGIRSGGWLPLPAAKEFTVFRQENGRSFYGMHDEIRLYPFDSPFVHQQLSIAVLLSKNEVDAEILQNNLQIVLLCSAFLVLGIVVSGFIVNRYLNPITATLGAIRSGNLDGIQTNIVELDQLIEEVRNLRTKGMPFSEDLFNDFQKRIGTLLPVEKKVFDYYLAGMADKEILSSLFITKDTLSKHNARIYEKLGVSGRDALALYIELIRMSGQADKIM